MRCSAIHSNVSIVFFVFDPSGFWSVVGAAVLRVFPEASLYTAFHGLFAGVIVQFCFHELSFAFRIAACYFFFSSKCRFFLFSLNSSLFVVL